MEPLESTSIHLVQSAIMRLLVFLPGAGFDARETAEYNRQTVLEYERIRDFIILHYKANDRPHPFWRQCRDMDVPDTLAEKIDLFRAGGRIVRRDDELFTEAGWLQVLAGQEVIPESWHPLADQLGEADLSGFVAAVEQLAGTAASQMPMHADFIQRNCSAS
jgi:tryptophan halogenase